MLVVRALAKETPEPARATRSLSLAPAGILILLLGLYSVNLIPPVPLSMQYVGIYRDIERQNGRYKLIYQKPPWTRFWQKEERIFMAQPSDKIHCFVRVFAPRRFRQQIFVRWSKKAPNGRWKSWDVVPIDIRGGRGQGFRGVVTKENYEPGEWRVDIEIADGRVLGGKKFIVKTAETGSDRPLLSRWM